MTYQRAFELLDPIPGDERCELDGNVRRNVEELQPDLVLPQSMPLGPPDVGIEANTAVPVGQCYLMPSFELAPTEQPDTARREVEYAAQVALQLPDVDADGTPTFRASVRALGRPLDHSASIQRSLSHRRPFTQPLWHIGYLRGVRASKKAIRGVRWCALCPWLGT